MKIVLATLCLNEIEWISRLVDQHRNWPGLAGWIFVEAADAVYEQENPDMVSSDGLSIDGTSEFLSKLDGGVFRYQPIGRVNREDRAQNKCGARNEYLILADEIEPHWIIVLDGDEFYSYDDQKWINRTLATLPPYSTAALFKQRHIWRPPSIADEPLMENEVVGAYWDIPHIRAWRWVRGMRHTNNHNHPHAPEGASLASMVTRFDRAGSKAMGRSPECVHMGFASGPLARASKHAYYIARGEGKDDGRQMYVDCRNAWGTWVPGGGLPHGARVVPYNGPVPECFL